MTIHSLLIQVGGGSAIVIPSAIDLSVTDACRQCLAGDVEFVIGELEHRLPTTGLSKRLFPRVAPKTNARASEAEVHPARDLDLEWLINSGSAVAVIAAVDGPR